MKEFHEVHRNLLKAWSDAERERVMSVYDQCPERKPKIYNSNTEAVAAIKVNTKKAQSRAIAMGRKNLKIEDAIDVIADTVALTPVPSETTDARNLAIFDYDMGRYTFSESLLSDYIVAILGKASTADVATVLNSLYSLRERMPFYIPLPKYKLAVGNGIFNCLTGELEPLTPYYTVLTKIETNYVHNAPEPDFGDGFTFTSMVNDFANGNLDRKALLMQICKSIVTGVHPKDAIFIILGTGGDGKSTFFNMMSNMLGRRNVAYANFNDIRHDDKMVETVNKKMMLGLDNNVNLYIKDTSKIKSMASHETIPLSRKYLSVLAVEFTPVVIQLCNEMPRFAEQGNSMERRVITFAAENSYYQNNNENPNVKYHIKDRRFLEHALFKILNESTTPYFTDYNDVDRQLTLDALRAEDVIGQFTQVMVDIGVIGDYNREIPLQHLYSCYLDWTKKYNRGTSLYGIRGFMSKMSDHMRAFGYEYNVDDKRVRYQTLVNDGRYSTESFGDWLQETELSQELTKNTPLRRFVKVRDVPITQVHNHRNSRTWSASSYFGVLDDIYAFAERHPDFDVKRDIKVTGAELFESSIIQKQSELSKYDAPLDIRTVIRQRDMALMEDYMKWFRWLISDIGKSGKDLYIQEALHSISDRIGHVLGHLGNDVGLVSLQQEMLQLTELKYMADTMVELMELVYDLMQDVD